MINIFTEIFKIIDPNKNLQSSDLHFYLEDEGEWLEKLQSDKLITDPLQLLTINIFHIFID